MGLVKIIELDDVLAGLNIDMKQFVDMWILLGTDYSDHFQALKVNQIYEHIVELKGITFLKYCLSACIDIESILDKLITENESLPENEKHSIPCDYDFHKSRDAFTAHLQPKSYSKL